MIMMVIEDTDKNVEKVSYKLLNSKQDFVAVIINITKISVYPNTWAWLNLIRLIVPKYLVSFPK